jgi:hypothetical protein
MAQVTAKVKCNSKKIWGSEGAAFEFGVDYADGRNKAWAAATPTLSVNISVKDANLFEVGKAYTLTFTVDDEVDE